jgi:biopolymer transport protein ExbD
MKISRRTEKKKARIEIIPMIDAMFFLLVFFMIATLSMTNMRGMPVNLPAANAARKDLQEKVSITLTKEGRLYYDKRESALTELQGLLKQDLAGFPELQVILHADSDVLHGKVVAIIDEVKLAGVTHFAIATKPKGQGSS